MTRRDAMPLGREDFSGSEMPDVGTRNDGLSQPRTHKAAINALQLLVADNDDSYGNAADLGHECSTCIRYWGPELRRVVVLHYIPDVVRAHDAKKIVGGFSNQPSNTCKSSKWGSCEIGKDAWKAQTRVACLILDQRCTVKPWAKRLAIDVRLCISVVILSCHLRSIDIQSRFYCYLV